MAIVASVRGPRACRVASRTDSRAAPRYGSFDCCSSPASSRTASSWRCSNCCTGHCSIPGIPAASCQTGRSSCCHKWSKVVLNCCSLRSSTRGKHSATESSTTMESWPSRLSRRPTSKTVACTACCARREIQKFSVITRASSGQAKTLTCCSNCSNPACDPRKHLNFV